LRERKKVNKIVISGQGTITTFTVAVRKKHPKKKESRLAEVGKIGSKEPDLQKNKKREGKRWIGH